MRQILCATYVLLEQDSDIKTMKDYAILIDGDTIVDHFPASEANQHNDIDHIITLDHHILAPGLINAHGHSAMTLLRGYSDDQPLMTWLEKHIWPAEAQWVSEKFVADGTKLAIAEMLLSGTTCFSDMYFFPEAAASTALESGIRAQLAFPIMEFPTAWGSGPDEYLAKGLKLFDTYKNSELIHIAFGPHAPYTVGDDTFSRIATLANEVDASIQVHLHETQFEVDDSVKNTGKRPLQRLADLGVLGQKTQCVHMTALNQDDVQTIAARGSHVVHCPQSNQKLASGSCPVQTLLNTDINVSLGTDGAASNNSLSMFTEMKAAALNGKLHDLDACSVSALDAFKIATINGAKALGIDHLTGSIKTGKKADIIAIDIHKPAMQPLYSPLSQLVYSTPDVNDVWVNGKQLVKDGELTQLNINSVLKTANDWASKIKATQEKA